MKCKILKKLNVEIKNCGNRIKCCHWLSYRTNLKKVRATKIYSNEKLAKIEGFKELKVLIKNGNI